MAHKAKQFDMEEPFIPSLIICNSSMIKEIVLLEKSL